MQRNKLFFISLILSCVLFLLSNPLGVACGILGCICLAGVQFSIQKENSKWWWIVGGNPTSQIKGKSKAAAVVALGMIIGPVIALFAKIAYLQYLLK